MPNDLLPHIPNFSGLVAPGSLDGAMPTNEMESEDEKYIVKVGNKYVILPQQVGSETLDPVSARGYFQATRNHLGMFQTRENALEYIKEMSPQPKSDGPLPLDRTGQLARVQPSFADPEDPEMAQEFTDMMTMPTRVGDTR